MRIRFVVFICLSLISTFRIPSAEAAKITPQYTMEPLGDHPLSFGGIPFEYRYGAEEPALYPFPSMGYDVSPYVKRGVFVGKNYGDYAFIQTIPNSEVELNPFVVFGKEPNLEGTEYPLLRYERIVDMNRNGDLLISNNWASKYYSKAGFSLTDLPKFSPSWNSSMSGMNDRGDVVGSMTAGSLTRAVAYIEGDLYDLQKITVGSSLYEFESALDIENDRRIILKAHDASGPDRSDKYFMLTPVPEPSSWVMATILALAGHRWNRSRKKPR